MNAIPSAPSVQSATLRVAVASTRGQLVDEHFGHADGFQVYDVSADNVLPVEWRGIDALALADEEPRDTICRMLADCAVLLVGKIGVAPQEKLAGAGIEASDLYSGQAIDTALAALYAAKAESWSAAEAAVDASDFKLLHAMLRISDLERSLDFYTRLLGMRVIEQRDHKKNQFTQVYLGYGDGGMSLELVFNWSRDEPYVQGDAFGHIAIEVNGITALCNRLAAAGVPMPRPPRSQRHGENIVAFIEDPDGHRIELMQRP